MERILNDLPKEEIDVAVPYYMGETLSKSFSNAKLITLSNANHSLFGSITETHWKLIRDFIQ